MYRLYNLLNPRNIYKCINLCYNFAVIVRIFSCSPKFRPGLAQDVTEQMLNNLDSAVKAVRKRVLIHREPMYFEIYKDAKGEHRVSKQLTAKSSLRA